MMLNSNTRVLVIGYGSTLRGDDGVGRVVVERLATLLQTEQVETVSCHQLTVELAEQLSEVDVVVLVDAATGDVPGAIFCEEVLPAASLLTGLLHYMEPGALLASTEALYGCRPTMFLWTVVADTFDVIERLSPAVQKAVPELLQRLDAFIRNLITPAYSEA